MYYPRWTGDISFEEALGIMRAEKEKAESEGKPFRREAFLVAQRAIERWLTHIQAEEAEQRTAEEREETPDGDGPTPSPPDGGLPMHG